jgi:hypothetical protein
MIVLMYFIHVYPDFSAIFKKAPLTLALYDTKGLI